MSYLGIRPRAQTFPEVAAALKARMGDGLPGPRRRPLGEPGAPLVPTRSRTAASVLTYDPKLRDAVEALSAQPAADLWPLFDLLDGVPLAVVRGANSRPADGRDGCADAGASPGPDRRRGAGPRPRAVPRRARGARGAAGADRAVRPLGRGRSAAGRRPVDGGFLPG